jgi:MFS family permease
MADQERMSEANSANGFDRRAVESWFRRRGLPLIVRRDERGSRLLQRATPALVFLLTVDPTTTAVTALLEQPALESSMTNTAYVFLLLALVVAAVVAPLLAGWAVSRWLGRLPRRGRWLLARAVLAVNVVVLPLVEWWFGLRPLWLALTVNVGVTLLALFAVWVGAGSMLAWGLRKAVEELGTVGRMATKALPLLVLVVIFAFFSTEMWQIASELPRWRLWLVVALFGVLAVLFMGARLDEELRKMIDRVAADEESDLAGVLRNTPLASAVDGVPTGTPPLSRRERANISLVLFVAQLLQILVLSALVFCVLIALGALAIHDNVIDAWLGDGRSEVKGSLFGVKLPLPHALVQVSLFLAAFSGLYFAASAATDQHYREAFFEPLLDDVRVSLAARQVYLARRDDAS